MDAAPAVMVGSTAEMPALELLRALSRAHSSGLLKVGSTSPAWAALADGQIVVAGLADGPTIGDALRAGGVVAEAALRDASTRGGAHDLALLSELATAIPIGPLLPIVREHTVSAVFQMILPSTERYAFQAGPPVALAHHVTFTMDDILSSAQERVRQWAEIAESVPSTQAVFRPRRRLNPELQTITLERDDWTIVAVLDGRRSVAQTIAATGRGPYEVCSTLHRLLQAGLIERIT